MASNNTLASRISELLSITYNEATSKIKSLFSDIENLILEGEAFYIDSIGTIYLDKNSEYHSLLINKNEMENAKTLKDFKYLNDDLPLKKAYKAIISTFKYIEIEKKDIDIEDFATFKFSDNPQIIENKSLRDKINKKFNITKAPEVNDIIEYISEKDDENKSIDKNISRQYVPILGKQKLLLKS